MRGFKGRNNRCASFFNLRLYRAWDEKYQGRLKDGKLSHRHTRDA